MDDLLMAIALSSFTFMVWNINALLDRGIEAAFIAPDQLLAMTPEEIALVVDNSKRMYINLHLTVILMCAVKTCMIILYLRITSVSLALSGVLLTMLMHKSEGLAARRWLIYASVYVFLSFWGCVLAIFLGCLPIQRRWEPNMDSKQALFAHSRMQY